MWRHLLTTDWRVGIHTRDARVAGRVNTSYCRATSVARVQVCGVWRVDLELCTPFRLAAGGVARRVRPRGKRLLARSALAAAAAVLAGSNEYYTEGIRIY